MFARKPISPESVASALSKAERYRLLNEPGDAESICRDILELEPANQSALVHLILALTDQFPTNRYAFADALESVGQLESEYDRAYYEGIAWERRAKTRFHDAGHSPNHTVYEWIVKALHYFEEAERLRPHGNDDSILRWNACVRFLCANKQLAPEVETEPTPIVSE